MKKNNVYIIGEIGQNHNGSVDIAKLITEIAARPIREDLFGLVLPPMDAVKLTKRDLKEELSASQMNKPYQTTHSFGKTYGEHREFLELSDEQHLEVYEFAKSQGLEFVETLCAIGCLSVLRYFTPDYLKVASRDLTNLPLLQAMAETKIPMILSTGMAGKNELDEAIVCISRYHDQISILHCVSQYPTEPKNANLKSITYLQKNYPQYIIGYSDHTIGIAAPTAAVALGARIIEKHITLDRKMKGTDQAGSLGVDGINRMVRDIRVTEMSLGAENLYIDPSVASAKVKLERSIATKRHMRAGEKVTANDIHLLSPGDGFRWSERDNVIGKELSKDVPKDEIIYMDQIKTN